MCVCVCVCVCIYISLLSYGYAVTQTDFFSLGKIAVLEEGKLSNRTRSSLLKN